MEMKSLLEKNFRFLTKKRLNNLPKSPGVYVLKNKKEILYIGKASNIRERVKNHFQNPSFRENFFIDEVEKIGYIKTDSEIEALILEAELIKKYQPKFNIVWRDDKNYFFVGITKEKFPRIFWTHQKQKEKQKIEVEYIGPFVDGKALKETLKILRKVFPFRSCKRLPKKPCLWYYLERCPGPCFLKESKIEKECQLSVKHIKEILLGKKKDVLKSLKKEMKEFAKKEEFEMAGKIRDRLESLERVLSHARIFEKVSFCLFNYEEIEKELKNLLDLKGKILRIEGYDISNIQGKKATGSMVVFINGVAQKDFYRKFKIKFSQTPNDIAMIKEVLKRRFSHPEWEYPQVILIDGGKAQLNAGLKIKNQFSLKNIKIVALAKRKNELFIEGKKESILLKDLPSQLSNLILRIRDEAHRFAKKYHLKLREIDLLSKS